MNTCRAEIGSRNLYNVFGVPIKHRYRGGVQWIRLRYWTWNFLVFLSHVFHVDPENHQSIGKQITILLRDKMLTDLQCSRTDLSPKTTSKS